jgi:hypothetical protein
LHYLRSKKIAKSTGIINAAVHEEESPKVFDPEEEKRREADKLLQQRFKTFDLYYKDMCNLFDVWDRASGNIFRQSSPSEKSDHDEHLIAKKNKKDIKGNNNNFNKYLLFFNLQFEKVKLKSIK